MDGRVAQADVEKVPVCSQLFTGQPACRAPSKTRQTGSEGRARAGRGIRTVVVSCRKQHINCPFAADLRNGVAPSQPLEEVALTSHPESEGDSYVYLR